MKLGAILNPVYFKEQGPTTPTEGFSFTKLNSMNSLEDMREYCVSSGLGYLGVGSSRIVFNYNGNALKVAINQKGISQNMIEYKMLNEDSDAILQIFNADKRGRWVLCEMAKPITNSRSFEAVLGIDYYDALTYIKDWWMTHQETDDPRLKMDFAKFRDKWEGADNIIDNPWIIDVIKLMQKHSLRADDLVGENLGVVKRDGQYHVVIIDLGYTNQVAQQEYRSQDRDSLVPQGPTLQYKTH